ncbi:MAG: DUF92 domain-containing protein [archaeon]
MDLPLEVLILFVILGVFSALSFKRKLLNFEGVLIANIVGIAIFLLAEGDLKYFFVAILFFAVAEAGTLYAANRKPRHETRTAGNILGNSGTAILALAFGFPFGFFAAFASALADTLSSEIGLLSKRKPVLITTWKKVEPGTDGGITPLGMAAALAGALVIAAVHFLFFQNWFLFIVLAVCGVFGSLADSFFGAAFERKGMLNNAEVNFLGSLGGTALAWALVWLV